MPWLQVSQSFQLVSWFVIALLFAVCQRFVLTSSFAYLTSIDTSVSPQHAQRYGMQSMRSLRRNEA